MILWTTILDKIERVIKPEDDLRFIDIRYLDKWIKNYSDYFPKFVLSKNYKIYFNPSLYRYEFFKIN